MSQESSKTEGSPEPERVAWDPGRVRQFIIGEITLGELEGIDKAAQYKMAETGFQLLQQGKLDDAKKVFEGLLTLDPKDAYFHMVLGSIAQRRNQFEDSEKHYSRSLRINAYSPSALANRGEVRVELGRLAEGLEDLKQAVKEDPGAREAATQRARALIPVVEDRMRGASSPQVVVPEEVTEAAAPTVEDTIEERTEPKAPTQSTPVADTKKSTTAPAIKSTSSALEAAPKKPTTSAKSAPKKK
jgi:tetratricopeptide (TPR) repeat protein